MDRTGIRSRVSRPALWILAVMIGLGCRPAAGQTAETAAGLPSQQLQLGLGVIPGLGLQGGYISPKGFYTLEGMLYLYASPRFAGGESDVNVALAVGGALRPLGIVRSLGNAGYTGYDIDIGARIGPGLTFAVGQDETLADKNKRFNLLFEIFARFTSHFKGGRTFFVELGGHRPLIRAGLWFNF